MKINKYLPIFAVLLISVLVCCARKPVVPTKLHSLTKNLYCITGLGGNVLVLKTEKGLFMVDSLTPELAPKLVKILRKISNKPVTYLINTHYHYDHVGGNDSVGTQADIYIHPEGKKALIKDQKLKRSNYKFLKKLKTTTGMKLKFKNETIRIYHPGAGHTGGDLIVVFEKAKYIHLGDIFFNGIVPFIDMQRGANTKSWIKILKDISKKYKTFKIVPGHGAITTTKTLDKFIEYLSYLRAQVAIQIKRGKTKEQTIAAIDMTKFYHLMEWKHLTRKNNISWIYDEIKGGK